MEFGGIRIFFRSAGGFEGCGSARSYRHANLKDVE